MRQETVVQRAETGAIETTAIETVVRQQGTITAAAAAANAGGFLAQIHLSKLRAEKLVHARLKERIELFLWIFLGVSAWWRNDRFAFRAALIFIWQTVARDCCRSSLDVHGDGCHARSCLLLLWE